MAKDDADDEIRFDKADDEVYLTKTGDRLTNDDLDALADEAEEGYDVEELKPRREWAALMINKPCPVCAQPYGFHNDEVHRKDIDPKYLLEKVWHQK